MEEAGLRPSAQMNIFREYFFPFKEMKKSFFLNI